MTASPFRSYSLAERLEAAETIIERRQQELADLEKRWLEEKVQKKQRILLTRIKATKNHLVSWRRYIAQGCPRVANATTTL